MLYEYLKKSYIDNALLDALAEAGVVGVLETQHFRGHPVQVYKMNKTLLEVRNIDRLGLKLNSLFLSLSLTHTHTHTLT